MTRHPSFHSPLRILAASELELIVGGAGKQDTLSAAPFLPGGGGFDHVAIGPPAAGAADGPGFTWPSEPVLSSVNGAHDGLLADDTTAVAPPLDARAADGAGFTWPAGWQDTLEDRGDDAADSGAAPDASIVTGSGAWDPAGVDAWADAFDPHQYVSDPGAALGSILPYQATEAASAAGLTDDGGGDGEGGPPHLCGTMVPTGDASADPAGGDWADSFDPLTYGDGVESIVPYQVEALPVEGDVVVEALGDDDGGGCHGGGHGDGDGGGQGDGSGRGDGGGCHDDGGCHDGDDALGRADGVGALGPHEVLEASAIPAMPIQSQYDWAFTPGNLVSIGGGVAASVWSQFAAGAFRR